jgi:hypothetical protein
MQFQDNNLGDFQLGAAIFTKDHWQTDDGGGILISGDLGKSLNVYASEELYHSLINGNVFGGCASLLSIDLSTAPIIEGNTEMGSTFVDCTKLVSVKLPDYVSNFLNTFHNCSSLTDLY